MMHKLASSLLAASMALTAFPAAAINVQLDSGANASVNGSSTSTSADTAVEAKASLHSMRCKRYEHKDDDKYTRCKDALQMHGKAHTDVHMKKHWDLPTLREHIKSVLTRTFTVIAGVAKRVCTAQQESSSATVITTVQSCMDGIKADIKANVTAMIDAAFTAQQ